MDSTSKSNLTLSQAITKAIGYTENGGKPDLQDPSSGKSGEMKSIFQFTPETWANDSKQVFGKDNVPLNNDTESYVTNEMVSKWLAKGYTPSQIFSMWNAGIGEPDAYTGKFSNGESSSGTNKEGVAYNVQDYVKKANKYLNEFTSDAQGGAETTPIASATPPAPSGGAVAMNTPPQIQGQPQGGSQGQVTPEQYKTAISNIVNLVKKGQMTPQQKAQKQTTAPGFLPTSFPVAPVPGVLPA